MLFFYKLGDWLANEICERDPQLQSGKSLAARGLICQVVIISSDIDLYNN